MMRNKNTLIALLVVAVVAALMATLWIGMQLGERKSAQVAIDKPGIRKNVPQAALPAAVAPNLNPMPAPWATPNTTSDAAVSATSPDHQKNLAELKEMQMKIGKLIQQNQSVDPKQVIQMLDKLKQINGSPVVSGVNIDNLRDTLVAANEAQSIAIEMNVEAKKPGGADPAKMKTYTQRLQQIQSQLLAAQPALPGAPK